MCRAVRWGFDHGEKLNLKKVGIIEDEESVRLAIEAGLQTLGCFEVHMARDGEAGLEMIAATTPDVLLLDLVLPGEDGIQIMRRMSEREDICLPARVVLMTAHSDPMPLSSLGDLGFSALLSKPFHLEELAQAIGLRSPAQEPG